MSLLQNAREAKEDVYDPDAGHDDQNCRGWKVDLDLSKKYDFIVSFDGSHPQTEQEIIVCKPSWERLFKQNSLFGEHHYSPGTADSTIFVWAQANSGGWHRAEALGPKPADSDVDMKFVFYAPGATMTLVIRAPNT